MNAGNKTCNSVHSCFQMNHLFLLWLSCLPHLDYRCHAENLIYSKQRLKYALHIATLNLWFIWQHWPLQQMTQIILITQIERLIALQLIISSCLIIYSISQSKDWPCTVQGNILWSCIGVLTIVMCLVICCLIFTNLTSGAIWCWRIARMVKTDWSLFSKGKSLKLLFVLCKLWTSSWEYCI